MVYKMKWLYITINDTLYIYKYGYIIQHFINKNNNTHSFYISNIIFQLLLSANLYSSVQC